MYCLNFVNNPLSVASKEVALPGEVQESLLSQSCDAKEVVLQLGEMMQLDQASLEEPKPETKTVIRSLARKAKDSNRLDVFEHLREITPAGTTGKSVIVSCAKEKWKKEEIKKVDYDPKKGITVLSF